MLKSFTRNWSDWQTLRKKLYRIVLKQARRDYFLDELVRTKRVRKFRRLVERSLLAYLKSLKKGTIRRAVEQVAKLSDHDKAKIRAVIEAEFGSFSDFLDSTEVTQFLMTAYTAGGQNALDSVGVEASFDLQNPLVIARLADRSTYLIQSVDETTKDQLSRLIARLTDSGLSWQEIASTIQQQFPSIAAYRSELIARMETANAANQAELEFYRRNGLNQKVWVLAGSHSHTDECDDNADAGPIPVHESFPSGDDAPPAHVNCMCVLNAVVPDDFIENGPSWLGE